MCWYLWVEFTSFLSVWGFPCSGDKILGRVADRLSHLLTFLLFTLKHEQAYYSLLVVSWRCAGKDYTIRSFIRLLGEFIQLCIVVSGATLFFLDLSYCLLLLQIYLFLKLFHKYYIFFLRFPQSPYNGFPEGFGSYSGF